jgi:hypothetical protein
MLSAAKAWRAVAADRWIAGRAAAITVFREIVGGSLGRRSSIVAFDPTLASQVLIPLLAPAALAYSPRIQ